MKAARPKRRHVALAALAVAGIAAACVPVAPAPTPKPKPTTPKPAAEETPNCITGGSGTTATSYAAAVRRHDDPSPNTPTIYTFEAETEAEKAAALAALERKGEVLTVERDVPVAVLEETTTTSPDSSTTSSSSTTSTSSTTTTSTMPEAPSTSPTVPADGEVPLDAAVTPDDPQFASGNQYGLAQSGFPDAWNDGFEGEGIVIAVVDTGVDGQHPDLSAHVVPGWDFVCGSGGGTYDPHTHGTHVAGIAAAIDNKAFGLGGAPKASILPVRVLSKNGQGSSSDVAAGINWAVEHGADVINLSLGTTKDSSLMEDAVAAARDAGVIVVAAAGNDHGPGPSYPASYNSSVIAVGASGKNAPQQRASFSNYGSWVDIAAPGRTVESTLPGSSFGAKSGTSMSSPFVAAAVALLLEKCGPIGFSQTLSILQASGSPIVSSAEPGSDPFVGLGGAKHLRVANALDIAC